ncbi:uncharacterized protein LOC117231309 [Bombus vosnesenskii]|uniref:Uncharacterized protein LOC117231309 n=2 Tax=Pyrobombus TaxID=144703 RepID=A0A6J3JZF6_9HYME|nr:uncharacterized protein LOC117156521 [Bombus vancouverensis nearcticus]XP_033312878.1 uncharacterized protein LOC117212296 [Bombus bifarius]XP_033345545.1 uncharacterized protein LOC117231309 [Bombus vosnesenskii]XP_050469775.1 uncharacterized protein LOC126863526 [Bombus huntii]
MIKKRIEGRQLAQNVGEQVIILGTIGKKGSNGKNIEVKTTDGVQVNVTLPVPIDNDAEGYIEIHGTLQSASTMNCSNYIVFPLSMTENFDVDRYKQLMVILNVLGPGKWKMSEDETGF